jgi:hypothetical protein
MHTFQLAYECATKEELVAHILGDHQNHRRISMYKEGCTRICPSKAALDNHTSAVHEKLKPFSCSVEDCVILQPPKLN